VSGPDRPVAVSSNCLFKGLPSCLRPFGLQFGMIYAILLLFILIKCRSQFQLNLLSFSSTRRMAFSFTNLSELNGTIYILSKKWYLLPNRSLTMII